MVAKNPLLLIHKTVVVHFGVALHFIEKPFDKSNKMFNFVSNWIQLMMIIKKASEFDKWIRKLKDIRAKSKILFRIQKLETDGHYGDCKPVGEGISEMRINYAKGYRIYFKEKDDQIVILLIGGDKSTQRKDIVKAKKIWDRIKNN
ncbi:type II toxin-antitoxin system RelE/ParE family toxin [Aequorivita viscosa]|nr:type II toxin-antitoxin system RelE/ParE family toxin [Aequorivita viscosa]